MTRNTEAALVLAASVLASLGVALIGFVHGTWLDAQVAVTFVTFIAAFGGLHVAFRLWASSATPLLLPLAAFLTALGTTEIARIDPGLATIQRWSLLVAAAGAAGLLYLLRNAGVALLRRYRYLFLAAAVVLLLLPLLPEHWPLHGAVVNGSRLWVRLELPAGLRPLSFQPGEVAKVLLTVFLTSYLADRAPAMISVRRRLGPLVLPEPRHLGPILVAAGAAFLVLVAQRDLGAALLLFGLFVFLVYAATGRARYLGTGLVLALGGSVAGYLAFGHVQRRVVAWLHPFSDYTGAGYQVAQGLFALGSGSLTGSGIGLGRPGVIPAAATDFIFAALGEELGLAGSLAILAAYALLVTVGFGVALRSRDRFRKFLAAGLTLLVGLQTLLILAGVLRLLPVTGITLPFISYGGSSLLASFAIVALLGRVSHEEQP